MASICTTSVQSAGSSILRSSLTPSSEETSHRKEQHQPRHPDAEGKDRIGQHAFQQALIRPVRTARLEVPIHKLVRQNQVAHEQDERAGWETVLLSPARS